MTKRAESATVHTRSTHTCTRAQINFRTRGRQQHAQLQAWARGHNHTHALSKHYALVQKHHHHPSQSNESCRVELELTLSRRRATVHANAFASDHARVCPCLRLFCAVVAFASTLLRQGIQSKACRHGEVRRSTIVRRLATRPPRTRRSAARRARGRCAERGMELNWARSDRLFSKIRSTKQHSKQGDL